MTNQSGYSVCIPSYNRPAELSRCLASALQLEPAPAEVIVVLRPDDEAGHRAAESFGQPRIRVVEVRAAGHIPPLDAGLGACSTAIMAVIDDDAVPRAAWAQRIVEGMRDSGVVAIGGPVVNHPVDAPRGRLSARPGGVSWYGAPLRLPLAGECDSPRCVRFLSGGNVAYRVSALGTVGFDEGLNEGAAVHYEYDLGLRLGRLGMLVFDPQMIIDHHPGVRKGAPSRDDYRRYSDTYTRHLYYIVAKNMGLGRRVLFLAAMATVGHVYAPGIARLARSTRLSGLGMPDALRAAVSSASRGWRAGAEARRQAR